MAKIFKPSKQLKSRKHASAAKQLGHFTGQVENYDLQLKGIVTNPHGKVAFVPDVLKGETIKVNAVSYTERVIQGELLEIIEPSPHRIEPSCEHYNECGGCQIQYLSNDQQTIEKQVALQQLMTKALGADEQVWQPPIQSPAWQYRRAARVVTWLNKGKEAAQGPAIKLGFRGKKSKSVVNVLTCPILEKPLINIINALQDALNANGTKNESLVPGLFESNEQLVKNLTHFQLFSLGHYCAVVVRAANIKDAKQLMFLQSIAEQLDFHLIAEYDNNEFEVLRAHNKANGLQLEYQADQLRFEFTAKDFIQINASVNEHMIQQAMEWLNPQSDERILDLFSGVGNFTLPLAKRAKHVIGVEGVFNMVKQLKHNAELNQLDNVEAYQADLSQFDEKRPPKWLKPIDKLLLDPARDGALAVMQTIPKLKPKQILYISCNPTTMVRDVKLLKSAGYELKKAGILNMFPNTSHVEAMVLLEK